MIIEYQYLQNQPNIKMIKKITLLFFVVFTSAIAQSIDFYQEKIELTVCKNYFEITGTYHFKNTSAKDYKHSLYYPFVIDETTEYPFEINVFDDKSDKQIDFLKAKEGVYFPIAVNKNDTSVYIVKYKQKISGNKAEYILTTTAQWGKPFTIAEYIITVPDRIQAFEISFSYDSVELRNKNKIYRITKRNFLPNKNLVVRWKRKLHK